ncbi:MAG: 5-dehydro-2-deoxygluconokinase [Caldimonas sp.]
MSGRERAGPVVVVDAAARPFDIVCMGRAAVDLYGEQIGGRLEDMRSFAKYLGGSPANTAVGLARLGLKPAMLTRVGDEHLGRFVRERLAAEGVDVGHVTTDPERLTALVFLGIRDRDTFPLVFYRDRCADMAIAIGDVDPALIASARALLLSGTHLSQPGPRAACERAAALARGAGARVVLDIDYRPVLWGLTGPGLGEQRYVESARVSAELQRIVPVCDLVVGTEEEIRIAGGSPDTGVALHRLRAATAATIVMKQGPMGCIVFEGAIGFEGDSERGIVGPGFPVEVFNVLGAGDAFMAGFLRGWLSAEPLARCAAYANACGALVVSRHGCAPAMPSWIELQHFLAHGSSERAVRFDADLEHLHRVTTRLREWPELAVLAFDHRVQFEELAKGGAARAEGATEAEQHERIARFKRLVAAGGQRGASRGAAGGPGTTGGPGEGAAFGVIVDDRYGEDVLPMLTGASGWIARPVEQPGSRPLAFEAGADVALTLRDWPTEHVAKCLVSFHPDDAQPLRAAQLATLRSLQAACLATDRELLIEVIPPREMAGGDDILARALDAIYAGGVRPDWWKLPPPTGDAAWRAIAASIERHDRYCRGVLLLGLEASEDELARSFKVAAPHAICRGFAVGRSIFAPAAAAWFAGTASDEAVVADIATRYARLVTLWRQARDAAGAAPCAATAASLTLKDTA